MSIAGVQLGLTLLGGATTIIFIGFFILFGVAMWALIDAIMIFSGNVTDNYGRKLR